MIQAALHLTAAALLAVLLGDVAPLTLVLALFLSLLPDIDTPKSLVGSLLKPLSVPLERRIGHRAATHSLLALALVAGVASLLAPHAWMVLAAAYASHLVLDLLIGVQGVMLFWPSGEFLTITGWRDDGRAPRALLGLLLPAMVIAASWPQLAPLLTQPLQAAVVVANPIATPMPTRLPTPIPTAQPSIRLRFELPAGVGLSALRVRVGDTLAEGQTLARWDVPAPTRWPTALPPSTPLPPSMPLVSAGDQAGPRAVAEAQAALEALAVSQAAARAALLVDQERALGAARQALAEAQRALDALQPRHERDQAERQHAIDAAMTELADTRSAAALVDAGDPGAAQRAVARVHAAEVQLRAALDAQDRMRTDQGLDRAAAEAAVAEAQAALDRLPAWQRQELAKRDADHHAAQLLAVAQVERARGQADDARRASEHAAASAAATATAATVAWQADLAATAQAYQAAVTATAQAQPAPAPTSVISRAAGRVVALEAEQREGQFVVMLELVP